MRDTNFIVDLKFLLNISVDDNSIRYVFREAKKFYANYVECILIVRVLQVTLEDQMICGALQTLNEEACEDVLEETEDLQRPETEIPQTAVIPPSPDGAPGEILQHLGPIAFKSCLSMKHVTEKSSKHVAYSDGEFTNAESTITILEPQTFHSNSITCVSTTSNSNPDTKNNKDDILKLV